MVSLLYQRLQWKINEYNRIRNRLSHASRPQYINQSVMRMRSLLREIKGIQEQNNTTQIKIIIDDNNKLRMQ